MNERRTHQRLSLSLEARWQTSSGQHTSRISNLGLGGCFIETGEQVAVGETISFKVRLSTGEWLALHGEVTYYQEGVGFGLRYGGLSKEERVLIAQLIINSPSRKL